MSSCFIVKSFVFSESFRVVACQIIGQCFLQGSLIHAELNFREKLHQRFHCS